jgi:hypothetical protein
MIMIHGLLALTGVAVLASAPAPTTAPPPTVPAAVTSTTAAGATNTTLPTQPTTTVPTGPTTTIPIPPGYTPLIDDSHTIVIAVPDIWTDRNTAPFIPEEGTVDEGRPSIVASPNIEMFYTTFDMAGVAFFTVPYAEDPLTYVGPYGLTAGCATIEVKEYDDPVFVGVVQVGTDCGPQHMVWNMVVASPADHAFTAILQVQTANATDLETVLRTFNVAP